MSTTDASEGFGFKVGQAVRTKVTVWDPPSGESPGGVYARPGEKVIVKRIGPDTFTYPISVAHEWVTDGNTFSVTADEIEAIDESGGE